MPAGSTVALPAAARLQRFGDLFLATIHETLYYEQMMLSRV